MTLKTMKSNGVPISAASTRARPPIGSLIQAHLEIARINHWTKNIFVLPGVLIPLFILHLPFSAHLVANVVLGVLAVCLVASSNYVINEVMDGPFDRFHPTKQNRPVVQGRVNITLAYVEWIALMVIGIALAWRVSYLLVISVAALWVMGCAYNLPPVRTKDLPFLDVMSEAFNNPLRLLAGWYMVTSSIFPAGSLLLSYWMLGCYFMAIKRFSEYREIGRGGELVSYRKSFRYYSERRLLVSIMFYASSGMLFFGAFMIRYRLELVLSFPLVALVMAVYLYLSFEPGSVVQNPEGLYRQPILLVSVIVCAAVMIVLLKVDIPRLHELVTPTMPIVEHQSTLRTPYHGAR